MDRSIAFTAFFFVFLISSAFLMLNTFKEQRWQSYLAEKNKICTDLSDKINENFTDRGTICECYYGDCSTESEIVNEQTGSYCVCDCVSNTTMFSVCVRQTF